MFSLTVSVQMWSILCDITSDHLVLEQGLRVSPLKGISGNAQVAGCPDVAWWLKSHLAAEALWALLHINETGAVTLQQKTLTVADLGVRDVYTPLPLSPLAFIFMYFSTKIRSKPSNRLAPPSGVVSPLKEILDPPLVKEQAIKGIRE